MVLMILSKREVRSAWKAFHWRQHRKMTIAARGRPLWKPTSPAPTAPHHHLSIPTPYVSLYPVHALHGTYGAHLYGVPSRRGTGMHRQPTLCCAMQAQGLAHFRG